jgi:hypothetical protein
MQQQQEQQIWFGDGKRRNNLEELDIDGRKRYERILMTGRFPGKDRVHTVEMLSS